MEAVWRGNWAGRFATLQGSGWHRLTGFWGKVQLIPPPGETLQLSVPFSGPKCRRETVRLVQPNGEDQEAGKQTNPRPSATVEEVSKCQKPVVVDTPTHQAVLWVS